MIQLPSQPTLQLILFIPFIMIISEKFVHYVICSLRRRLCSGPIDTFDIIYIRRTLRNFVCDDRTEVNK
jgi:hypothetical protein